MPKLEVIPGQAEGHARHEFERACAFFHSPVTVCGVPLRPLTVRDVLLLETIQSPFFGGSSRPTPGHLAQFLWAQSVEYLPGDHPRAANRRHEFIQRVASLKDFPERVREVVEFIDSAFVDRLPSTGREQSAPVAGFGATVVDWIATAYGWDEETILKLPMTRAFQYMRLILKRMNPGAVMFNRYADEAVGNYLKSVNARN